MVEFFTTLTDYFQYSFVWYALIASVLIALCSSLFGVTLVLKRFSFIGDGLSHVAFGAMAVAGVLRLTQEAYVVLPITVLTAVLLLKAGQNAKIKGDAIVAMISVSSLAIGYLLLNLFPTSSNVSGDVCTTLFGSTSIVTLGAENVWLCAGVAIVTVVLFVLFYNRIFAVTFDESFAKATGVKAELYNLITAVIIAVIIVVGMEIVGSLLISALIIFPALSAMRVCKSFKSSVICSVCVSVICAVIGVVVSVPIGTPVGTTIVAADALAFLGFCAAGYFLVRKKEKKA